MDLARGDEPEARTQIRLSLQARQAALSTAVSRLLASNNEEQERAAIATQLIYPGVERNLDSLLAALLVVIVARVLISLIQSTADTNGQERVKPSLAIRPRADIRDW